jgi:hypothetical protein
MTSYLRFEGKEIKLPRRVYCKDCKTNCPFPDKIGEGYCLYYNEIK